jgi:GNAT superfamily N-acetyltransferase
MILPAFQGLGIGTALVLELIEEARSAQLPLRLRVLRANRARGGCTRGWVCDHRRDHDPRADGAPARRSDAVA